MAPSYPPPPLPPLPSIAHQPHLNKSSSWNGARSETNDNATFEKLKDIHPENANGEKGRGKVIYTRSYSDVLSKYNKGLFPPPPISSIGSYGKPRAYFKSYKEDGRFVLREIRIPTQQLLQVTREDGRLRMQVVQPVEDIGEKREEKGGDER